MVIRKAVIRPKRDADRERREQVHAHFRNRRVDQQQAAESEQHDSADGENSVRRELGFGGEESEGSQDQSQRGKARGKKIQRKGSEQDEHDSDGSGDDRAGVVEFDVERKRPDGEEQEREVGIHQRVEDGLLQRHVESDHRLAREVERGGFSVEALERFALHLAKEIFGARRDVIDEMLCERFLFGEGLRFAHRAFGCLNACVRASK